jgi:hypothetical protein
MLLGSVRIQSILTGATYPHLLQEEMSLLLENIDLQTLQKCAFLYPDGAPHTFLLMSGAFLNINLL